MKMAVSKQMLQPFAALVAFLSVVHAQSTYCSSNGTSTCDASNRICIVDNSSNESCGACAYGYIEFSSTCTSMSDVSLESFLSDFKPYFSSNGVTSNGVMAAERSSAFQSIMDFISFHNSQNPPPSFVLTLNKFAADTLDEVKERLGLIPSNETSKVLPQVMFNTTFTGTAVDWEQAGAVTSVKDQGRCGCCWAVSVAGAVEGAAAISSGFSYLQSLSFQQFISCDDTNFGCNGGDPVNALQYADSNSFGGMTTLNDYSFTDYNGRTTESCSVTNDPLAVQSQGAGYVVSIDSGDTFDYRVTKMKQALAHQPVSVSMHANCQTISVYGSGIITDDGDCACQDVTCIDHAVLLVGFNDDVDIPYWKVKNSWGKDWGEQGFFRVAQANPTGSSWGLFGLMSEGLVPTQAYNVTNGVPDKPQTAPLQIWQIAVIAAVVLFVLVILCSCIQKLCGRK